ncbi:white collar-2 [Diplodia corticola]|uniref:White collar-2 n=1 Tax=Diplodia corticola TaxID=236234 RepID=A0A1J9RJW6_9PEZI|nr:white collar-2 [Diplodia corticola]OJD28815.1 white collar-2 [Diplodia corticola]
MPSPEHSTLDSAVVDAPSPTAVLRTDLDALLPPTLDDIVLSSLHHLHFVLSPSTTILRVSANCLNLLGCEPNLLLGQRLAALIHKDDAHVFSSEIDDALLRPTNTFDASLAAFAPGRPPFRFYCRIRSVVHIGSDYSAFELVGHYQVKMPASLSPLQLMMPPPGIISITARPAFTRKGRLMDGMLELKMEQIHLVALLREMRREAAGEGRHHEADVRHAGRGRGRDGVDGDDGGGGDGDDDEGTVVAVSSAATPMHHSLRNAEETLYWRPERRTSPPGRPLKRSRSSPPRLTWMTSATDPVPAPAPAPTPKEEQHTQTPGHRHDPGGSPPDGQSGGEGSPGESSKVKLGDAGIPFFIRPEGYERKISDVPRQPKRKFAAKDHCCSRCGTVESPEWRAGPDGPKTLCNACGLKYAKEQKRAKNVKGEIAEAA